MAKRLSKTGDSGIGTAEVLDALPFYVMLIDSRHHVLGANRAVTQALGVSPERLLGGYCPRVIHGLDGPFPGCPLEIAVDTGGAVEKEIYDPDRGAWLRSGIYPIGKKTGDGDIIFLHLTQNITDRKTTEIERDRQLRNQLTLSEILRFALAGDSLEEALLRILRHLFSLPWLELESKGAIFIVEGDPPALAMKAHSGLAAPLLEACRTVPFGRCLCGLAAQTREVQHASHIDARHAQRYEGIIEHGHYCIPILSEGRVLGVMNFYLKSGHPRDEKEVGFLLDTANVLAGIIERRRADSALQRTLANLEAAMEGTVLVLAAALERRDPYTAGHQRRVAQLGEAMARVMDLPQNKIQGLRLAGIVHDIGKIAVPAEILSKPTRLSGPEMALIKIHPQAGFEMIKGIPFPWPVAEIVRQHHEFLDGSGYPRGLAGDEILQEARILAVADVVEAMASHRPYRPALGIEKALGEIDGQKGKRYDPAVVDVCLSLFRDQAFRFDEPDDTRYP
jgi:putative nucleotidyltransferase with HDIG domain